LERVALDAAFNDISLNQMLYPAVFGLWDD